MFSFVTGESKSHLCLPQQLWDYINYNSKISHESILMAEGYILNHLSGVLMIRKLWLGLERWLSSQEYLEAFVEHAGSVLSTHVGELSST